MEKEKLIKKYYDELGDIQMGKNPNIKPITSYEIDLEFREKGYKEWDKYTRPIVGDVALNFFRELHEFFRFLISHAFLNIHNRKVVDGKLYCNQEDFDVALRLMKRTIEIKYKLLKTERFARRLNTARDLDAVMKSPNIPEEDKNILKNLIKTRGIKY